MNTIAINRIKKELEMLSCTPPPGISCCPVDKINSLSAQIMGEEGTPFEGGVFALEIQIPDRYPFDPPLVKFITPIYHPNIDANGRICLDTLKLPPKGSWRPCLNISTVLMMVQVLMGEPGTEDPLMTDIWQEFKCNYSLYAEKAKQWTRKYAKGCGIGKQLGSETSSLTAQGPPSTSSNCTEKDVPASPNKARKPEERSVKTKKGLKLSTKRSALEQCDVNIKASKMS